MLQLSTFNSIRFEFTRGAPGVMCDVNYHTVRRMERAAPSLSIFLFFRFFFSRVFFPALSSRFPPRHLLHFFFFAFSAFSDSFKKDTPRGASMSQPTSFHFVFLSRPPPPSDGIRVDPNTFRRQRKVSVSSWAPRTYIHPYIHTHPTPYIQFLHYFLPNPCSLFPSPPHTNHKLPPRIHNRKRAAAMPDPVRFGQSMQVAKNSSTLCSAKPPPPAVVEARPQLVP